MPSKTEIEAQITNNGGYTRETLAKWGISWPPPKGWKEKLIKDNVNTNQKLPLVSKYLLQARAATHTNHEYISQNQKFASVWLNWSPDMAQEDVREFFTFQPGVKNKLRQEVIARLKDQGLLDFKSSPTNEELLHLIGTKWDIELCQGTYTTFARFYDTVPLKVNGPLAKHRQEMDEKFNGIEAPKQRTPSETFYNSDRWKQLRYQTLLKNDGQCELCGRGKHDGVVLHVDHIKPRSKHPDLEWAASNLQVLCGQCNIGKSNLDDRDWRKPEDEPRLSVVMGERVDES
jgi:hypothetical protein|tara:strand:+ start:1951 stop:2814 length:864 start_codon:yes stop_codon:yes gene_type:complete